ncbi:hypothetical protein BH24DEI2_BH24DEI2_12090 [soil metagenome]
MRIRSKLSANVASQRQATPDKTLEQLQNSALSGGRGRVQRRRNEDPSRTRVRLHPTTFRGTRAKARCPPRLRYLGRSRGRAKKEQRGLAPLLSPSGGNTGYVVPQLFESRITPPPHAPKSAFQPPHRTPVVAPYRPHTQACLKIRNSQVFAVDSNAQLLHLETPFLSSSPRWMTLIPSSKNLLPPLHESQAGVPLCASAQGVRQLQSLIPFKKN